MSPTSNLASLAYLSNAFGLSAETLKGRLLDAANAFADNAQELANEERPFVPDAEGDAPISVQNIAFTMAQSRKLSATN
jgi:hypothetical protein